MSIIIRNITDEFVAEGLSKYELRINEKLICKFSHDRKISGLADCLRDAANAVDAIVSDENKSFYAELLKNV